MKRAPLLLLAMPMVACWPGESSPTTADSPPTGTSESLEASAQPSPAPVEEPPLRAIATIERRDLDACAIVASGVVCSTIDAAAPSALVHIDEHGESTPVSIDTSGRMTSVRRASDSAVVVIVEAAVSPELTRTVAFRACSPWHAAEQIHVFEAPLIDAVESSSALIVLQGGTAAPSLVTIPGDCAQPVVVTALDGAQTVSALTLDATGEQVAVTGLRSRSLHVFNIARNTITSSELSVAAVTELPLQPYVLANRGAARWVILPANSPTATMVEGSGDTPVIEEFELPAALHRLVATEAEWVGWSASEQTLFVGGWADPSSAVSLPGFPNLRSLRFASDGRIVGVDEEGGFVVSADAQLRREGYEGVSAWLLGPAATWAVVDRALYELVP